MSHLMNLLIKIMADYLVVPIVLLAAWALLTLPRDVRYQRIAQGVVAGLTALLIGKIASIFYQGERPFELLHQAPKAAYLANHGFPSDHVLFVTIITLVVWAATKNRKLTVLLIILSVLVGIGRVLALVHTPFDVLGGIACASIAAGIVYRKEIFNRDLHSTQPF